MHVDLAVGQMRQVHFLADAIGLGERGNDGIDRLARRIGGEQRSNILLRDGLDLPKEGPPEPGEFRRIMLRSKTS